MPPYKKLIPFLKEAKNEIFEPGSVPGDRDAAPFHALALQLVAKGLIDLDVNKEDEKYVGTDKLKSTHARVKIGLSETGMPQLLDAASWEGLNCVEKATPVEDQSTPVEEEANSVEADSVAME